MKLSSQDICAVIKAAGDARVSELSLGNFKVTFKREETLQPFQVELGNPEVQEKVSAEVTEVDEIAHKDDLIAQMEIENPAEYERLMLAGDLIPSKDGAKFEVEGHSGP